MQHKGAVKKRLCVIWPQVYSLLVTGQCLVKTLQFLVGQAQVELRRGVGRIRLN